MKYKLKCDEGLSEEQLKRFDFAIRMDDLIDEYHAAATALRRQAIAVRYARVSRDRIAFEMLVNS